MELIHVKSLEKYHPGYKDRKLQWAKLYFTVVNGDPEFEVIDNEIDKWRYIAIICLELNAQKPLLNDDNYWKKHFDIKKRPMSLTLKMLHNFIDTVTQLSKDCVLDKEKDKDKDIDIDIDSASHLPLNDKVKYLDFVYLKAEEHAKLTERFGAAGVAEKIEKLNNYIGSKGIKYKSHYHTILNWAAKDVPVAGAGGKITDTSGYDTDTANRLRKAGIKID